MGDLIFVISSQKKPGGRFVAMLKEPADDEKRIVLDVETIKIHVPEKRAQGFGDSLSASRGDFILRRRCHIPCP
ncbi:MAG: hypothetical protein AB1512_02035 [Thermodesulfobacteriota bacterium]